MPYFDFKQQIKKQVKKQFKTKDYSNVIRKGHNIIYGTFSKYGNNSAVYGIKCNNTNKIYVGSTKHLQRRLLKHFNELHHNRHRTKQMQKDYNEYGIDSFTIIVYSTEKDNLLTIEKNKQIEIGIDNLYNEKISGYWVKEEYRKQLASGHKRTHKTKEFRDKMSKLKTNRIAQYTLDYIRIKEWDSAIQICEELGYTRSVILSCCNGSKPKAYGYHWNYIDDNGNIVYDGYAKGRKKI